MCIQRIWSISEERIKVVNTLIEKLIEGDCEKNSVQSDEK